MSEALEALGFAPFFRAQLELLPDSDAWVPARVVSVGGGLCRLAGCLSEFGRVSGHLSQRLTPPQLPTTGDWVCVEAKAGEEAVIHHILDRRTALKRRAAGSEGRAQIIAANVDVFFIVTSANRDLNPRRVERYLSAVWESGARPVVVLNKVDLVENAGDLVGRLGDIALAVPIVGASAKDGTDLEALRAFLDRGVTVALVGSSGVGKSSLINRLLGQGWAAVNEVRQDGKGRHTTTRRELLLLEGGGLLMDTPGMREFGMIGEEGGLDATFSDVVALADACRFSDCSHDTEPGCAVHDAIGGGSLDLQRLEGYRKLLRELRSVERRRDAVTGANSKRRWKDINKAIRTHYKTDPKRKR